MAGASWDGAMGRGLVCGGQALSCGPDPEVTRHPASGAPPGPSSPAAAGLARVRRAGSAPPRWVPPAERRVAPAPPEHRRHPHLSLSLSLSLSLTYALSLSLSLSLTYALSLSLSLTHSLSLYFFLSLSLLFSLSLSPLLSLSFYLTHRCHRERPL